MLWNKGIGKTLFELLNNLDPGWMIYQQVTVLQSHERFLHSRACREPGLKRSPEQFSWLLLGWQGWDFPPPGWGEPETAMCTTSSEALFKALHVKPIEVGAQVSCSLALSTLFWIPLTVTTSCSSTELNSSVWADSTSLLVPSSDPASSAGFFKLLRYSIKELQERTEICEWKQCKHGFSNFVHHEFGWHFILPLKCSAQGKILQTKWSSNSNSGMIIFQKKLCTPKMVLHIKSVKIFSAFHIWTLAAAFRIHWGMRQLSLIP